MIKILSADELAAGTSLIRQMTPGPWMSEKSFSLSNCPDVHWSIRTVEKLPEHPWSPRYIAWMTGCLRNADSINAVADSGYRYCEHCKRGYLRQREVGVEVRIDEQTESDVDALIWLRNNAESLFTTLASVREELKVASGLVAFWKRMAGAFGVDLETFRRDGVDAEEILSLAAETVCVLDRSGATRAARAADAIRFLVKTYADADERPLPLIIHCPKCHMQHVDVDDETGAWATTRKHRKHLCKPTDGGCGYVWAPATAYTVGVQELPEAITA